MQTDDVLGSLSVFGLGYVGCVSAACFASRGSFVIGLDVNPVKTGFLRAGRSPIVEDGISELTASVVDAGLLTVGSDAREAVLATDASLVCVGTPSCSGGAVSTAYLERVCAEIGAALRDKAAWHVVVFRSTMTPGTCMNMLIPRLESASGKRAGIDFGVCVNPEFLREGTSVADFFHPPKTVVGATDEYTAHQVMHLYDGLDGPRFRVDVGIAEMTKYVDNSFHALKVGFSNEIGAVCSALHLDSHAVMDVFLSDTKLNISPAYLRPGFAFGGSCLPKDVRALTWAARRSDVDVPILSNLLVSNETHLRRALDLIVGLGRHRIGILGLAFKPGTDDLRESPTVELAERLLGKGFDLRIHDRNVSHSQLTGANRSYIRERMPHIGELLTGDTEEVLAHSEVLVVAASDPVTLAAVARARADSVVVDLVRLPDAEQRRGGEGYVGIGW